MPDAAQIFQSSNLPFILQTIVAQYKTGDTESSISMHPADELQVSCRTKTFRVSGEPPVRAP